MTGGDYVVNRTDGQSLTTDSPSSSMMYRYIECCPQYSPYGMLGFLMSLWQQPQRPKIKYRGGRVNVNVDFLVNNNQQTNDQNNNNNNQNNGLVG